MLDKFRSKLENKAWAVVQRLSSERQERLTGDRQEHPPENSGKKAALPRSQKGSRKLTEEDLKAGRHRKWVGGDWERKGRIQIEFLKERGLKSQHKLLDVGCGALRGGLHFVDYLELGHYYGIEADAERIRAGRWELEQASLEHKSPNLLANTEFEVGQFGATFEYALAVSLFTHLDLNRITRCLYEVGRALDEGGEFYATFIEAPSSAYLKTIPLGSTNTTKFSSYDTNPYHYAFSELEWVASNAGLSAEYVGDWGHPGNQKMALFKQVDS